MIYDRSNSFVGQIAESRREVENMKSSQIVGASSLIIYNNQTNDTWDIVEDFIDGSNMESKWRVTFTPDTPGASYAEFEFKWLFDPYDFYQDFALSTWDDPDTADVTTHKSFIIQYSNQLIDQVISLKFGVRATSLGDLSWERIV